MMSYNILTESSSLHRLRHRYVLDEAVHVAAQQFHQTGGELEIAVLEAITGKFYVVSV